MRKINYKSALLAALLLLMVFVPVKGAASSEEYEIYYVNQSETELKSRRFRPQADAGEALIKEFIEALNQQEESSGRKRLLPEHVEIQRYVLREGGELALVFSEGYKEYGIGREILIRTGVVRAFTQIPDVQSVEFYVGSDPLTDSRGNRIGALSVSNFSEIASDAMESYRYDKFTLYFTNKDGTKLLPEVRTVYYKRSIPKGRVALEQLIKGPMEKGHYPTLPDSVTLQSITIADKICYVDLNRVFRDKSLNLSDSLILNSVGNTLIANTNANKVEITVDKEKDTELSEGTNLYQYIKWNEELIGTEDEETE
ncbi:MAG: GerMN domain-containing protein [Eubacteriales bacterium]|nr:GerMN domain-containing protein [Eubacteriales bacterium]